MINCIIIDGAHAWPFYIASIKEYNIICDFMILGNKQFCRKQTHNGNIMKIQMKAGKFNKRWIIEYTKTAFIYYFPAWSSKFGRLVGEIYKYYTNYLSCILLGAPVNYQIGSVL